MGRDLQWGGVIFINVPPLTSDQVRRRVTNLVSKAYKTIKLSELCTLLGQSEEQVKQGMYAPSKGKSHGPRF